MQSDFIRRMGLDVPDIKEVRTRFLNRISISIFRWLQDNKNLRFWDENFIWWIGEELGEPYKDRVEAQEYHSGYWSDLSLDEMAGKDFYKTLAVVEKCYQYIAEGRAVEIFERYVSYKPQDAIHLRNFEEKMQRIMVLSEGDLGVFWKGGKFYPSGAKELDEALIADSLDWLETYPKSKKQFLVALNHFKKSLQSSSAGKDAITNSYTSVEALAKEILGNDVGFDKNSDALVNKLSLPSEYKNIVHYYKLLAHEYGSRHAGSDPLPKEVEAFVYLTGLLLRLMTNPT